MCRLSNYHLNNGNYDTTGLNADRVENIFAFCKWCVRRGLGKVDTRTRYFVRTYSQGSHYVAWKLTTFVATSRAVSKAVVGCTLTIGRAYSRLSVGIRYERCNDMVYGSRWGTSFALSFVVFLRCEGFNFSEVCAGNVFGSATAGVEGITLKVRDFALAV